MAALIPWLPGWAQPVSAGLPTVSGSDIRLRIAHQLMTIDGKRSHAIGINGTIPGPLIRLKKGQIARLHVENAVDEDSSIHWHGLLLPAHMAARPVRPNMPRRAIAPLTGRRWRWITACATSNSRRR